MLPSNPSGESCLTEASANLKRLCAFPRSIASMKASSRGDDNVSMVPVSAFCNLAQGSMFDCGAPHLKRQPSLQLEEGKSYCIQCIPKATVRMIPVAASRRLGAAVHLPGFAFCCASCSASPPPAAHTARQLRHPSDAARTLKAPQA